MNNKDWWPIFDAILYGAIAGILLIIATEVFAYGPKTEGIIPIGKSPGLSGVCTTVGDVVGLDVLEGDDILHLVIDTPEYLMYEPIAVDTDIWLNGQVAPNGLHDVVPGLHVEMKGVGCCYQFYEKYPNSTESCKMWIKLESNR